jgi:hypothetical protein
MKHARSIDCTVNFCQAVTVLVVCARQWRAEMLWISNSAGQPAPPRLNRACECFGAIRESVNPRPFQPEMEWPNSAARTNKSR